MSVISVRWSLVSKASLRRTSLGWHIWFIISISDFIKSFSLPWPCIVLAVYTSPVSRLTAWYAIPWVPLKRVYKKSIMWLSKLSFNFFFYIIKWRNEIMIFKVITGQAHLQHRRNLQMALFENVQVWVDSRFWHQMFLQNLRINIMHFSGQIIKKNNLQISH